MRILLAAALLATATPALADETSGVIVAFDRVANVLVLEDSTVWTLSAALALPENLVAGEKVHIVYTSEGDNGVKSVDAVHRMDG